MWRAEHETPQTAPCRSDASDMEERGGGGWTKFGHWCRPGRKARILGRKRRMRWAKGGKAVAERALAGARLHALCAPLRQRQARERAA